MNIDLSQKEEVLFLKINDAKGSYRIPFIQSCSRINLTCVNRHPDAESFRIKLIGQDAPQTLTMASSANIVIDDVAPGEYTLHIQQQNGAREKLSSSTHSPVAVGYVFGAIGDSITEGYRGKGFFMDSLDLKTADFPRDVCSKDQRNYPQFAPTTYRHIPEINCFASWMPMLNDRLTEGLRSPVFIANEGWGGITSGGYLKMMREDQNWLQRIALLKPNRWLIHLGVNDERQGVSAEEFYDNMCQIITILTETYGANGDSIFLSTPCYDYHPGAPEILEGFLPKIRKLIDTYELSQGPDFFQAYSTNKEKWYGADPVHPNIEGMDLMAKLWSDAILKKGISYVNE